MTWYNESNDYVGAWLFRMRKRKGKHLIDIRARKNCSYELIGYIFIFIILFYDLLRNINV
jgi:hypothetical protein